jgi:maltose O-acetyltransferase
MTEKEKSKRGLLYNANFDEELIKERAFCKDLCHQYNEIKYSDIEKRNEVIKKIIENHKENFLIEQPFWCDYGYNIELGENFYSNHNLVILDAAEVKFGDNVFIGPNCGFYTAGHPVNISQRNEGLEYAHPISVGNNVWIGGSVVVLPGVSIGDNSIIGAGSVVTKDIPENVIAVGNPCRVIKEIFREENDKQ